MARDIASTYLLYKTRQRQRMKRVQRRDRSSSAVPVQGSQNLIRLSLLPDTRRRIVECHSTHLISHLWWVRIRSSPGRPSAKDQTRAVESSPAVANMVSSGGTLSSRMASRCVGYAVTSFMLGCKYSMIPDRTADTMYASAWLEVSV